MLCLSDYEPVVVHRQRLQRCERCVARRGQDRCVGAVERFKERVRDAPDNVAVDAAPPRAAAVGLEIVVAVVRGVVIDKPKPTDGGAAHRQVKLAADGLARLTAIGASQNINVIVENHGGLSSNADWLAEVISKVNHPRCGTLPDTGNFRIKNGETYDSYRGMAKLLKWAKGVSIKDKVWDGHGQSSEIDFEKMLKIVVDSGFHGYCGIEYGGYAGLKAARTRLERVREKLEA